MKTALQRFVFCALALAAVRAGTAATTDISSTPLETGSSGSVKPNIMLLLDDSGSMAWDFMPDWIGPSPLPGAGVDKPRCGGGGGGRGGGGGSCGGYATTGLQGDPPYYASQFNGIYYNPNVYYPPGVKYDGTTMTSYTAASSSNFTKVPVDAYGTTNGTINLVSAYPEAEFCSTGSVCKRNGIDTGNKFLYNLGAAANGYPDAVVAGSGTSVSLNGTDTITITPGTYETSQVLNSNPYYFTITPAEYCSDTNLTQCTLSQVSTGSYIYSGAIRYCYLAADQNSLAAVSGNFTPTTGAMKGISTPRCQKKYNQRLGYQYPRFGYFNRFDIIPGNAPFVRNVSRTDCASPTTGCTYSEEMTNFANWYAYYHVRIQMAKSAVGLAFNTLTASYRVGFLTINAYSGGNLNSAQFLPIGDFTTAQKQTFYSDFYKLSANNGTPLREALSRVGWYYAGKTSGLSAGMITATNPDPVQYSCQQNFTIMTTDGYWNGNGGQDLSGNSIDFSTAQGQQDNDPSNVFEQRASSVYGPGGYYDGNLANTTFSGLTYTSKGTLADVAMYYYKTDLRPAGSTNFNTGLDVSADNVPTAQNIDQNPAQHMVTYTIGMGVDGYLTYDTSTSNPSYLSSDYLNIVNGAVAGTCVWTTLMCDWPQVPTGTGYNDDPAKDDDLWHAAINGRGSYLSAKNPQALLKGLTHDLAVIQAQVGAAAASATSTPNITTTNNAIYSTTFRTAYWDGEMVSQQIDPSTGNVLAPIIWSAKTQLLGQVGASSDTRTIYTLNASKVLVSFNFASLDATAQAYFSNKCAVLSQCSGLVASDQAIVNSGANLIGWLRGQSQYADATHFRSRTDTTSNQTNVLGDLVDSRPAVVTAPYRHYGDLPIPPGNQSYAAYAATYATRQGAIYIGAGDGMLHAFDTATGNELWAYVPRMLLSKLYLLSDIAYATQHKFYVDGSPEVVDVLSPIDGMWHAVLVVGMNAGGRGYVAFDVTNPTNPKILWEFCNDSTVCSVSDANLGLSFGNPVITKRAYDGKWVVLVASGYNNATGGDGLGHVYELDPFSGAILQQASTGVGSTTTPSGLAKIAGHANNPDTDNTTTYAYGGDLQGNLWRINLTGATMTLTTMATLNDAAGKPQSVTTSPEIGLVNNLPVIFVGTGRLLGATDLQNPSTLTPPGNWSYVGSMYALLDNGSNLGNPRANALIVQQTFTAYSATQYSISNNTVSIPTNLGWYVDFPNTGERVNVDPQLALGTLLVVTNIPTPSACNAGGNSFLYQFNYNNGGPVAGVPNNIVGTETVGALTVGLEVVQLQNGNLKGITNTSDGKMQTNTVYTGASAGTARRVGWRGVSQ